MGWQRSTNNDGKRSFLQTIVMLTKQNGCRILSKKNIPGWWVMSVVIRPGHHRQNKKHYPAAILDSKGKRLWFHLLMFSDFEREKGISKVVAIWRFPNKQGYPQSSSSFMQLPRQINHPAFGVPPWPWKPPVLYSSVKFPIYRWERPSRANLPLTWGYLGHLRLKLDVKNGYLPANMTLENPI